MRFFVEVTCAMNRKCKIAFSLAAYLLLFAVGCADKGDVDKNMPLEQSGESSVCEAPEDVFKEMFPEAEIFDCIFCDLDENGEDDAVILYTWAEKSITSGLAVCLSGSNYSGIDLTGDKNGIFLSKAELTVENGLPVISIKIKLPETERVVLYHVEYSYDKTEKEANFRIITEEKSAEECMD